MITIIDYKAGNLRSVEKAFIALGHDVQVTDDAKTILASDKVILPGVGSFADAMNSIKNLELEPVIKETIKKGTPFLGICLGMQLMYEESEEGNVKGLSILKGKVKRFPDMDSLKVPQIGWNNLNLIKPSPITNGIEENPFVYFVHSYYVEAEDIDSVIATVEYGVTPHVLVQKDNLFLAQFHPEKSGRTGLKMLDNFAKMQVSL